MANSLNKATIIGNVGKEPEIRSAGEGKEIAVFSVATTDSWKDKVTGEKKERTEWHRIVVFNDALVNVIKMYVKKGSKLYIEGAIQTRKWVDSAGVERYTTEIVIQGFVGTLIMLDTKSGDINGVVDNRAKNDPGFKHEEFDDEIPF